MRLIESSYKILPQEPGLDGIYKMCEIAGRTAYKSEDRITEGSAKKFVDALIKLNHGAVLEHGTIYLHYKIPKESNRQFLYIGTTYGTNPYSKTTTIIEDDITHIYVTTNLRVLLENNCMDDLQYLCEPTEYHERRISVKFICSRSIAQEITRHRVFSFLMESQRYVAYNKDKFGGEITYIIPDWVKLRMNDLSEDDFFDCQDKAVKRWFEALRYAEYEYMGLIGEGLKAEEARSVLPNDCKTELVMTGFVSDWEHFFDLRALDKTGKAHMDIKALACPLRAEFILNGYVND
jgi:thymidylate synthase (FAD)